MRRDWDLIREVLLELEQLSGSGLEDIHYDPVNESDNPAKDEQALILWKAGFIEGINDSTLSGNAVIAQGLTWAGHDLLATIQSKPIWERIKSTAQDKGIELSFDAVKALAKITLAAIVGG